MFQLKRKTFLYQRPSAFQIKRHHRAPCHTQGFHHSGKNSLVKTSSSLEFLQGIFRLTNVPYTALLLSHCLFLHNHVSVHLLPSFCLCSGFLPSLSSHLHHFMEALKCLHEWWPIRACATTRRMQRPAEGQERTQPP